MPQDRYIPGVPCWADTTQPDPQAAAAFYSGIFGWELEDVQDGSYLIARLRGEDVAAISAPQQGAPAQAMWNTYIWVDSADESAAKVRDAGGAVLSEPFDVTDAGRMAVCADREGAVFSVWEARGHRGSQIVNEHGSVNFNDLHTRDPEAAKAFYGAVFGWGTLPLGGGFEMWALPGYGDFLEEWNPGTRKRMIELGAPAGFEDVIGSLAPIPDDQPDTPPHWGITFAVDDADAIAAKTQELGGTVIVPPLDAPWVRMTIIADPQGAVLTASKFVPENKDLEAPVDAAAQRA